MTSLIITIVLAANPAWATDATRAPEIISRIEQTIRYHSEQVDDTKPPEKIRYEIEALEKSRGLEKELASIGAGALVAIRHTIEDKGSELAVKQALARCLSMMPDSGAERLLLELKNGDSALRSAALGALRKRVASGIGLESIPPGSQVIELTNVVKNGRTEESVEAAKELILFHNLPDSERIGPVVGRFRALILEPEPSEEIALSGGVNVKEWGLAMYLRIFDEVGEPAQRLLREHLVSNEDHSALTTWIVLALGISGDSSVADDIRELVDDSTASPSIRALGVRCFTRSAGQAALADLDRWVDDSATVSSKDLHHQKIRVVAREALLQRAQ